MLILAAGLAAGCSALRLGYNQAPALAFWWLDGYADFDDAQTPRVRDALADWFAWHRRTQLPDYAALLARAETEALADTTPERACQWWADLNQRVNLAAERGLPAAARLALTLTPDQIDHIDHRYAKFNAEFRDEYLQPDPAKRLAESVGKTVERAEMLYGRLDEAQRAAVARRVAESPFDADVWFAERRQRQQDALQMLRKLRAEAATGEQAEAALRAYLNQMQRSPRDAYRRYSERLVRFNCEFTAALHNGMTPAQRKAAVQKLKGWESDLRALAADD